MINVSSIAGHRIPGTTSVFYSATKHAVRVITEGLRMEVCVKERERDTIIFVCLLIM